MSVIRLVGSDMEVRVMKESVGKTGTVGNAEVGKCITPNKTEVLGVIENDIEQLRELLDKLMVLVEWLKQN